LQDYLLAVTAAFQMMIIYTLKLVAVLQLPLLAEKWLWMVVYHGFAELDYNHVLSLLIM